MKGTHISQKAARRQRSRTWCNHPGCHQPADHWDVYNQWQGTSETLNLCYDHMLDSGFCLGCGYFCAGIESFDFSPMQGYCSECVDEIRAETGEDEDDYPDYYDDPLDDYEQEYIGDEDDEDDDQ